jgi:FkbM family methyltransferase
MKIQPLTYIFNSKFFAPLKTVYVNKLYRKNNEDFLPDKNLYKSIGISSAKLIFDLGANKGHKTDVFQQTGAKVVVLEPDSYCFNVLSTRFQTNKRVVLINKAVSDEVGKEELFVLEEGNVLNTINSKWKSIVEHPVNDRFEMSRTFRRSYSVETLTIDNLIDTYGVPDFIKIDVEGNEWRVLSRLSHPIRILSFEANLPEFLEETLNCMCKLNSLNPEYQYNYVIRNLLILKDWMNFVEMEHFLKTTKLLYCEIIAKSIDC